jgi:hypothetical protein
MTDYEVLATAEKIIRRLTLTADAYEREAYREAATALLWARADLLLADARARTAVTAS